MRKHAVVTVRNYTCFVYSYYTVQIRVLIVCLIFAALETTYAYIDLIV